MDDSRLTTEYKNAAARVLQHTWHIYKCLSSNELSGDNDLRLYQRKFLRSIHKSVFIPFILINQSIKI